MDAFEALLNLLRIPTLADEDRRAGMDKVMEAQSFQKPLVRYRALPAE